MDMIEAPAAARPIGTIANSRAARWLAWALWALALAQVAGGLLLALLNRLTFERFLAEYVAVGVLTTVSFATAGLLIARRRPQNPISWLICAAGVLGGLGTWAGQYARYAYVTNPGALPFGDIAAWLYICPAFGPFLALTAIFLPLLFPDGRLPSRRWRPLAAIALCASILFTLLLAISPGPVDASLTEVPNPFGLPGARPLLAIAAPFILALLVTSMAGAIAAAVVRLRRARGVERQQLKWFVYATALLVLAIVGPGALAYPNFDASSTLLSGAALAIAFPLLPAAIGIAILRYRLWDIDILINRTLVYGALTACISALYVVVVGYLGALFHDPNNLTISLVGAGLVAVLFQPLRARLQRGVNHLLYGERDEPYAVLARLGQRMEATLAPDAVLPTLVETVATALRLPYAAVMLKQADAFVTAAEYRDKEIGRQGDKATGGPDASLSWSPGLLVSLSLNYQGEVVGKLLLAPRAPGASFSPADRRLLAVLAQQAGVAAHAVRLTYDLQNVSADLQHARERLIAAREEERRRIRRDLHDGVGPVLSSLVQRLDLARSLLEHDPDAAGALIDSLKREVRATLADIRRLVYALRPPALDEFGLLAAIREQAAHYQQPDGLRVGVAAPAPLPALPAAVEVAAYRIALEALTNVARHARARQCEIMLTLAGTAERQALCLEVLDDGVGLPEASREGIGMVSIRERAAELGGTCTIERRAQGGTRICAWLPLP
jgi:signal transduction histidine kinase